MLLSPRLQTSAAVLLPHMGTSIFSHSTPKYKTFPKPARTQSDGLLQSPAPHNMSASCRDNTRRRQPPLLFTPLAPPYKRWRRRKWRTVWPVAWKRSLNIILNDDRSKFEFLRAIRMRPSYQFYSWPDSTIINHLTSAVEWNLIRRKRGFIIDTKNTLKYFGNFKCFLTHLYTYTMS